MIKKMKNSPELRQNQVRASNIIYPLIFPGSSLLPLMILLLQSSVLFLQSGCVVVNVSERGRTRECVLWSVR